MSAKRSKEHDKLLASIDKQRSMMVTQGKHTSFPYAGRKPGVPNLTTKSIVEKILRTLDKLGGEKYLEALGRKDKKLFVSLLRRVIPTNVQITGTLTFEHKLVELERSRAELAGEVMKALPEPGMALSEQLREPAELVEVVACSLGVALADQAEETHGDEDDDEAATGLD